MSKAARPPPRSVTRSARRRWPRWQRVADQQHQPGLHAADEPEVEQRVFLGAAGTQARQLGHGDGAPLDADAHEAERCATSEQVIHGGPHGGKDLRIRAEVGIHGHEHQRVVRQCLEGGAHLRDAGSVRIRQLQRATRAAEPMRMAIDNPSSRMGHHSAAPRGACRTTLERPDGGGGAAPTSPSALSTVSRIRAAWTAVRMATPISNPRNTAPIGTSIAHPASAASDWPTAPPMGSSRTITTAAAPSMTAVWRVR